MSKIKETLHRDIEIWDHHGQIKEIAYTDEQVAEFIQDELQKETGVQIQIDVIWKEEIKLGFNPDNIDNLTNEELNHLDRLGLTLEVGMNTEAIKKLLRITFHVNFY